MSQGHLNLIETQLILLERRKERKENACYCCAMMYEAVGVHLKRLNGVQRRQQMLMSGDGLQRSRTVVAPQSLFVLR